MAQVLLQCRRPGFNPWVGKIPWRRERLPTPVFCPGEFHGLQNPWGHKESDTTRQLSLTHSVIFEASFSPSLKSPYYCFSFSKIVLYQQKLFLSKYGVISDFTNSTMQIMFQIFLISKAYITFHFFILLKVFYPFQAQIND